MTEDEKEDWLLSIRAPNLRIRAKISLDNWGKTMQATRTNSEVEGITPSIELLNQYILWSKGNLFVGPEGRERIWDPGSNFDEWGQYFLPAPHYAILNTINVNIDNAIAELRKEAPDLENDSIKTVVTSLKSVASNYNYATPFDHTKWTKTGKWKPTDL